MLWQHDPTSPIGVWEVCVEDETGLWLEKRLLPSVRQAAEAITLIEAGAIHGLSIGYRIIRHRKDQFSDVRHLLEIDLVEVSIVSLPANAQARIATGKENTEREMKRALERLRLFSFPSVR
jgi:HK97 family phage prohead protease